MPSHVYKTPFLNLRWPENERVHRCQLLNEHSWLCEIGGASEIHPCYTTSHGEMNGQRIGFCTVISHLSTVLSAVVQNIHVSCVMLLQEACNFIRKWPVMKS